MDLRDHTDDALSDLLAQALTAGDETTAAAVESECNRRDRRDAQKARDKERWAATYAAWLHYAQAQWLQAEHATNGVLLNKAGDKAGINPRSLWSGSLAQARRYASEELLEFWQTHPRLTVSQYHRERRAERRAEREQYEAEQAAA
jgi:hypothetical protein